MIIDYDFLSYVTFDQQLKITFRKSSGPPEKVHSPLKNSKSASPSFLLTLKIFQGPPAERGGGRTLCNVGLNIRRPKSSSPPEIFVLKADE